MWSPSMKGGTTEESAVATCRTRAAGKVEASLLEKPATARPAGLTGSTDTEDPRAHASAGAGSGKAARGATTEDSSWSGYSDRIGIRVGHRNASTFLPRQADRQLRGAGSL